MPSPGVTCTALLRGSSQGPASLSTLPAPAVDGARTEGTRSSPSLTAAGCGAATPLEQPKAPFAQLVSLGNERD